MKHLMLCLLALGLSAVFTACDKDDDDSNGPAFSKDGKRLVKSMTYDIWDSEGEKGEFRFRYDGNGQLNRIEITTTWEDDENGKTYTDTEIYTYSVSGKELTAKYSTENDWIKGVFSLNDDGFVVSGTIEDNFDEEEINKETYQCFYNEQKQLTGSKLTDPIDGYTMLSYTWNNDNYVEVVQSRKNSTNSPIQYTYYDTENKTNLNFDYFLNLSEGFGNDDLILSATGYIGKGSKNLMKSCGTAQYTYEFDSEGYVTQITETHTAFKVKNTYTVKYN